MEDFSLWGAIVNALAVILGSGVGLLIKRLATGRKKGSGELSDTVLKGLALGVLGVGITGMAIGTEDFLYENANNLRRKLDECGYDFTYREGKGAHDWDFWDEYIQYVFEWIANI